MVHSPKQDDKAKYDRKLLGNENCKNCKFSYMIINPRSHL